MIVSQTSNQVKPDDMARIYLKDNQEVNDARLTISKLVHRLECAH